MRSDGAGPSSEVWAARNAALEPEEEEAAAAAVLKDPPVRPRLLSLLSSTEESTEAYHSPPVPSSIQ